MGKVTGLVLPKVKWNGDTEAVKPNGLPSPMLLPKMLRPAFSTINEDAVGSFEEGDGCSLRDVEAALRLIGFAATAMAMTRELLVLFLSIRL